jgi:ferredoxin-fold anticodon binding domain-containing protein
MQHCLAIKNEIISFAGKWMEMKIIKLSETRQIEEDKYQSLTYVESFP